MFNRRAFVQALWRPLAWALAVFLLLVTLSLPRLVGPGLFGISSHRSPAPGNGKWTLFRYESPKYLFLHEGQLYTTSCLGESTDQVFRENCASLLPLTGQSLEGNVNEGRFLVIQRGPTIFHIDTIEREGQPDAGRVERNYRPRHDSGL